MTTAEPDAEVADGDEASMTGGLAKQATSNVLWSIAQKWVLRITGLVTIVVLMRLLRPEDFGLVAAALPLVAFVQLLSDLGFSAYLVQAKDPTRTTINTAFWFAAVTGFALAGLLMVSAPAAAWLLGTPAITPVIQAIAPAGALVALGAVPISLMRRAMRFQELAVQAVVAGAAAQVVAIAIALSGYGVWALVAQTLVHQLLATALAWRAVRWMPSWRFSPKTLMEMVRFGIKVVAVELLYMGRLWAENAIIIMVLGTAGLGYLNAAQRLIQVAQDLTTAALVPVSVVVFARIRDAVGRLRSGYLRAQSVCYVLVTPIMLFIAVGAPWLIPLLFGPQWGASIVPAQIIAIAGIFAVGGLDHGLLFGLGKPGVWLAYAVVIEIAMVTATLVAVSYGLRAVAWGFLVVGVLATLPRWMMVGHQLKAPWYRIGMPLMRCVLPAAVAGAAAAAVGHVGSGLPATLLLACIGVTMAMAYVPMICWMVPSAWEEATRLARPAIARLRARGSARG